MVSFKYLYAGSGRGKSAFYHKYQYIYIGKIFSCDIGPYYFRKQNLFHNLPISILFISFVNIFVFHANLYICKNFINFSQKKRRKKFVFFLSKSTRFVFKLHCTHMRTNERLWCCLKRILTRTCFSWFVLLFTHVHKFSYFIISRALL